MFNPYTSHQQTKTKLKQNIQGRIVVCEWGSNGYPKKKKKLEKIV